MIEHTYPVLDPAFTKSNNSNPKSDFGKYEPPLVIPKENSMSQYQYGLSESSEFSVKLESADIVKVAAPPLRYQI